MSPWVRIDENAMDHPKFLALSDGAWRLWCEGQSYCQKHLTDGVIHLSALKGFRYFSPSRLKNLTTEFVPGKGPCWHRDEDGTVHVHDYLDWNDSREEVLAAREGARARRRRHDQRTTERVPNGVPDADETPNVPSGVGTRESSSAESMGKSSSCARTARTTSGVMAGTLPRDHLNCRPPCIRVCLSQKQHALLRARFGGDETLADVRLDAWYQQVRDALPETPIGDRPWQFWEQHFAAHFSTAANVQGKTAGNAAAAARFVARGRIQ